MSVFNWIIDLGQESKINDHQEQIEKMQKEIDILTQWIRYLNDKIEHLEQK